MTGADPASVLRRALLGWGLGHLALGRSSLGIGLLVAEVVGLLLVAWLTAGLADTSLYLVPFLAGAGFVAAWAAQAVHAYRLARAVPGSPSPAERSPALGIAWLTLPLLAWGSGFWIIGADAATPASALDRFVSAWTAETLDAAGLPPAVVARAEAAESGLGEGPERFRDVRIRVVERGAGRATAVAEAIHFERRPARFLWLFPGSELVPVADREVLRLELSARPAELPGGGDIGAVRWEIVAASR